MGNTKPIGVAYSDQDLVGSDTVYVNGQLGYTTAAQGTVTQLTSKSTAVTLNKSAGQITLNNAALAGGAAATFTLTNSLISTNDIIIVNVASGGTAAAYTTYVSSISNGSAILAIRNLTAGSLSEAVVINFALIHCQ
jgi:hypothetical protein